MLEWNGVLLRLSWYYCYNVKTTHPFSWENVNACIAFMMNGSVDLRLKEAGGHNAAI